jgi:hypothetical protein
MVVSMPQTGQNSSRSGPSSFVILCGTLSKQQSQTNRTPFGSTRGMQGCAWQMKQSLSVRPELIGKNGIRLFDSVFIEGGALVRADCGVYSLFLLFARLFSLLLSKLIEFRSQVGHLEGLSWKRVKLSVRHSS